MSVRATDVTAHAPAAGELAVGQVFAGYRIEALIARGGMGVVFRARHLRLGREVGLKVLAPHAAASEDLRRRFVDESRAAAALDHPGILPLYEAGDHNGILYITTRLVEGDSLKDLLARHGRLSLDHARALVIQTGAALDAAHRRGLVHRDVKPANLLLAPDGADGTEHVYLTDFGLTKRLGKEHRHTRTGEFVGTIAYCAPEQIRGEGLDGRADVYALGCVLYECVTGEVPFRRASETDVLLAHCSDPPPRPSARCRELPAELDDVIATALAKDPDERLATCAALSTALRGMRPHPVSADVPAGPSPARRHRIVIEDDTGVRLRQKAPTSETAPRPAGPVRRAVPSPRPTPPERARRVDPSPRPTPAGIQPPGDPSTRRRPGRRVAAALIFTALAIAGALTVGALLLTREDGAKPKTSASTMDIARRTGRLRNDVSGLARQLRAADQAGDEKARRRIGRQLLKRRQEATQLSQRADEELASEEFAHDKLVDANGEIASAAQTMGDAAVSGTPRRSGHSLTDIVDGAQKDLDKVGRDVDDLLKQPTGGGGRGPLAGPASRLDRILTLPGDADLQVLGTRPEDALGSAVASAGDVNGDGLKDTIATAADRGAAVVVFGSPSPEDLNLDDIGQRGLLITGLPVAEPPSAGKPADLAVAPAGDIDDDGFDDVLIGAPSAGSDAGAAFVIFGRENGGEVAADRLTPESGWRINGRQANERLGGSVAAADVNDDDRLDLVLGAGSPLGALPAAVDALASSAYVLSTGGSRAATPDLGDALFRIRGSGERVAAVGDVNGDDVDDVAISDTDARSGAPPTVHLVYGSKDPLRVDVSRPGDWGLTITGSRGANEIGDGVAAAGDLDGDGDGELLIPDAAARSTWVIRGGSNRDLDLGGLGDGGFAIDGGELAAGDIDVNGDGKADVIVADGRGARVLFGGDLERLRSAGTGSLPPGAGRKLRTDAPVSAVALVGDMNGDSVGETVVGSAESGGSLGGVFVVMGRDEG